MKSKFCLFAIIFIVVVSLVPLSGVSAQRTTSAPASAASMAPAPAPAARATYSKTIKYRVTKKCGGAACFSYTQKITWTYDYDWIVAIDTSHKGLVFVDDPFWYYDGYVVRATAGGAGSKAYYCWTEGWFFRVMPSEKVAFLNIAMIILYDGTYWKGGWKYTVILT